MLATAKHIEHEVTPWELGMLVRQRKTWVEKGGDLIALSRADKADLMAKTGTIGDDIVETKPELRQLWEILLATAKRSCSRAIAMTGARPPWAPMLPLKVRHRHVPVALHFAAAAALPRDAGGRTGRPSVSRSGGCSWSGAAVSGGLICKPLDDESA